ncbi:hypothetical protein AB0J83_26570 [Actinoplanes sp. NPDC049596]|uniref:hypothetical protein n=1 Tax=unclassified Actinoplanes TaxID=2626549 RepID=UPI00344AB841
MLGRGWVRVLLLTFVIVLAGLIVCFTLLDLDRADKIASSVGGVAALITVGATYLARSRDTATAPAGDPDAHTTELADVAKNELTALADLGLMRVPWARRRFRNEDDLAEHLAAGGQLVIVGASQSGKTTLAVRLMALLDIQPVLFRLHSWDPIREGLETWLSSVLRDQYGLLGEKHKRAVEDLAAGRLVPFFDGFDELDPACHRRASSALRRFTEGRPAVLTGIRTEENSGDLDLAMPNAEVITLAPVTAAEVRRYLLAVPATVRQPWKQVAARLQADDAAAVRAALSSPLNAWLMKTIYAGSGRRAVAVMDELCGLPDAQAVEAHLLGQLVPAVFERRTPARFVAAEAEHWLGYLAHRATHRTIAFWQLRGYAPLYRLALAAVVPLSVIAALAGPVSPAPTGAMTMFLTGGVVFGFGYARGYSIGRWKAPDDPARVGFLLTRDGARRPPKIPKDGRLRDHLRGLGQGLGLSAVSYAVCLLVWWLVERSWDPWLGVTRSQFTAALVTATVIAGSLGYAGGRLSVRVLRALPRLDASTGARTVHPLAVIRSDRRSGVGMLILGHAVFVLGYLVYAALYDPPGGLWGTVLAPVGAVAAFFFWNQWSCYKAAHIWLSLRDRLPWAYTRFLQECHETGILRQNGNHYTFRHHHLQGRLKEIYEGRAR